MEHSLHLGAHHFVKSLNNKFAGKDNEDLELLEGIHEIESSGRGEEDVEEDEAEEFRPGDVLGKVLALIGLVSTIHLNKFSCNLQVHTDSQVSSSSPVLLASVQARESSGKSFEGLGPN